jgi:hypothetical protein
MGSLLDRAAQAQNRAARQPPTWSLLLPDQCGSHARRGAVHEDERQFMLSSCQEVRKESASFLKKRSKKLLFLRD